MKKFGIALLVIGVLGIVFGIVFELLDAQWRPADLLRLSHIWPVWLISLLTAGLAFFYYHKETGWMEQTAWKKKKLNFYPVPPVERIYAIQRPRRQYDELFASAVSIQKDEEKETDPFEEIKIRKGQIWTNNLRLTLLILLLLICFYLTRFYQWSWWIIGLMPTFVVWNVIYSKKQESNESTLVLLFKNRWTYIFLVPWLILFILILIMQLKGQMAV
jgi:hypothetical protein